jgi:hypothetical protein
MLLNTVYLQQLNGVGNVFSIHVLAGIVGDCVVGLPQQLTGNYYLEFLLHGLLKLLGDMSLTVKA